MPERVNLAAGVRVDGRGPLPAAVPLSPLPPRPPAPRRAWLPWRPRCLWCGERGTDGRDLCAACDAALPRIRQACPTCGLPLPITSGDATSTRARGPCDACRRAPPPLTLVVAPFLYAPPFDRWLPRFKFHRDMAAGRLLAQLMLDACAAAPRPDAIVPIPLHRARLRARGYNQALELAKPIARRLLLPLLTDVLARSRATSAQSSLPAVERRANLRGAFAVAACRNSPPHVVLVDDVMTTGATLHAAAEALRRAGASRIDAWACARTP